MIAGIISGALAGYVAAKLTDGKGKGCLVNLVVGIIGGALGDWLFGLLGMTWQFYHEWIAAVVGACIFLWLWNRFTK